MQDFNKWLARKGIKIKRNREERLAFRVWEACQSDIIDQDNKISELELLLKQQNELLIEIKESGLIKD